VYQRAYAGLYCVGCEQFYAADELVDGACPDHETPLETVNESNYFFALSRYQALLESKLGGGGLKVLPDSYLKESSQWLQRGLADFSISRSHERARGWGVAVADDPTQVVYVWFDALTNYLSGLGYAEDADNYRDFWRLSQRRIHVVGKNVTRFHCIYWPAILASAGLAAPTEVVVHGFLTAGGRKIGKSLGNGVDPFALVDEVGRDRLRYYLLRHFPLGRDGDFSRERLVVGCNAALSDQLGNLLSRVVTLVSRECGGRVPPGDPTGPLQSAAERATEQAVAELEACAPDRALAAVLSLVEASNALLARVEPWRLATLRRAQPPVRPTSELTCEIEACLAEVCRALLWVAGLLAPFLPDTAERIAGQLGAPAAPAYRCAVAQVWSSLGLAACVERGEVLFARL
jgi:methionyl-tRNA synthetase